MPNVFCGPANPDAARAPAARPGLLKAVLLSLAMALAVSASAQETEQQTAEPLEIPAYDRTQQEAVSISSTTVELLHQLEILLIKLNVDTNNTSYIPETLSNLIGKNKISEALDLVANNLKNIAKNPIISGQDPTNALDALKPRRERINETMLWAMLALSQAYITIERHDEAMQWLAKAQQIRDTAKGRLLKGDIYRIYKKYKNADAQYEQAIKLSEEKDLYLEEVKAWNLSLLIDSYIRDNKLEDALDVINSNFYYIRTLASPKARDTYVWIILNLTDIYIKQGNYKLAIQWLKKARRIKDTVKGRLLEGDAYRLTKNYYLADAAYARAVTLSNPKDVYPQEVKAWNFSLLAASYLKKNKIAPLVKTLNRNLKQFSTLTSAKAKEIYVGVILNIADYYVKTANYRSAAYWAGISQAIKDTSKAHWLAGDINRIRKKYKEADDEYSSAVTMDNYKNPQLNDVKLWNLSLFVNSALSAGNLKTASDALTRNFRHVPRLESAKLKETYSWLAIETANRYISGADYDAAFRLLDLAEQSKDMTQIHLLKGNILRAQGKFQLADIQYAKAISKSETDPNLQSIKAANLNSLIETLVANKQYKDAETAIAKEMDSARTTFAPPAKEAFVWAIIRLSEAYSKDGRYEDAAAWLDKAASIKDVSKLHVLKGDAYRQDKRFADADAEYAKAIALSETKDMSLYELRAWNLSLMGRQQAAEDELLKAYQLDPNNFRVLHALAVHYCARRIYKDCVYYAKQTAKTASAEELESGTLANLLYSTGIEGYHLLPGAAVTMAAEYYYQGSNIENIIRVLKARKIPQSDAANLPEPDATPAYSASAGITILPGALPLVRLSLLHDEKLRGRDAFVEKYKNEVKLELEHTFPNTAFGDVTLFPYAVYDHIHTSDWLSPISFEDVKFNTYNIGLRLLFIPVFGRFFIETGYFYGKGDFVDSPRYFNVHEFMLKTTKKFADDAVFSNSLVATFAKEGPFEDNKNSRYNFITRWEQPVNEKTSLNLGGEFTYHKDYLQNAGNINVLLYRPEAGITYKYSQDLAVRSSVRYGSEATYTSYAYFTYDLAFDFFQYFESAHQTFGRPLQYTWPLQLSAGYRLDSFFNLPPSKKQILHTFYLRLKLFNR